MYFINKDPRVAVDFMTVVDEGLCVIKVKTRFNRRCTSLNRIVRGLEPSR